MPWNHWNQELSGFVDFLERDSNSGQLAEECRTYGAKLSLFCLPRPDGRG